jgi:hypothetical protein
LKSEENTNASDSNLCYCFEYNKFWGDLYLYKYGLEDGNSIDSSVYYYQRALNMIPTSNEIFLRLAYLFDLRDSLELAKFYYNKLSDSSQIFKSSYCEISYKINVNDIKKKSFASDSIKSIFMDYKNDCKIIFDYFYTYQSCFDEFWSYLVDKEHKIIIYGNKKVEIKNLYSNKQKKYISKQFYLSDSVFSRILEVLAETRFVSLFSIFNNYQGFNAFNYYPTLNAIDYEHYYQVCERITVETPLFSNTVVFSNLVDGVFANKDYYETKGSFFDKKILKLAKLWQMVFSDSIITNE